MQTINQMKDSTIVALNEMGVNLVNVGQKVLGAVLILIIGWIITKIVIYILKRALKFAKADKLTDVINEKDLFGKTDLKPPSAIINC